MIKLCLIVLPIIFVLVIATSVYENLVEYYVNLVDRSVENLHNVLPTSAEEFREYNFGDVPELYGDYDFIIVGLGSAGSVIANRLSEVSNWTILALEAGQFGDDRVEVPNLCAFMQRSEYNWGFISTPQTTCCQGMMDKRCNIGRGLGVGGSTLINYMIHSRGHRDDYDAWAAMGNPGWSYEDVLPHFIRLEDFHQTDKDAVVDWEYHGTGGDLHVEYHHPRTVKSELFIQANIERGYQSVDYNANQLGASIPQVQLKNGRRYDNGRAFILPILNERPNLTVLNGSYVHAIMIDGPTNRSTGVVFNRNNRKYFANARKEVILTAGVFMTPHLLMLSGIGPRRHLESLNIPVVRDLEVGSTLKDHTMFLGMHFVSVNYTEPTSSIRKGVEDYLEGQGVLSRPGNVMALGYYKSRTTPSPGGSPDIELMLLENDDPAISQSQYSYTDEVIQDIWGVLNPAKSMLITVHGLHPRSNGSVRLRSSNPFDYPLIDLNMLSDVRDAEILYEGVQLVMDLMDTDSFRKIGARYFGTFPRYCSEFEHSDREHWLCTIRYLTQHFFHHTGTCPMGNDVNRGAVVDSQLRVHGIKGLRIGDASVIPVTIGGHPSLPIMMVGDRLANFVKNFYLNNTAHL